MRQRLKKREFILKLTFSLPLPSSMLKLPNASHAEKSQQAYSEALLTYLRSKTDARSQENPEKCCPPHRLDPLTAAGGTLKKVTVS